MKIMTPIIVHCSATNEMSEFFNLQFSDKSVCFECHSWDMFNSMKYRTVTISTITTGFIQNLINTSDLENSFN